VPHFSFYQYVFRRVIRKRNLAFVAAHNEEAASGKHGFTLKENDRIDWVGVLPYHVTLI